MTPRYRIIRLLDYMKIKQLHRRGKSSKLRGKAIITTLQFCLDYRKNPVINKKYLRTPTK